jgi:hypothetical protein
MVTSLDAMGEGDDDDDEGRKSKENDAVLDLSKVNVCYITVRSDETHDDHNAVTYVCDIIYLRLFVFAMTDQSFGVLANTVSPSVRSK